MKTYTIRKSELPTQLQITEEGQHIVQLVEDGAEVEIRGAFHTREKEQLSVDIVIQHMARHTHSDTLLRGVAEDQSFLKLSGTIIVAKDAQQTNAFLTENILLLSPQARAEAIPNLEIEANEVKCSHAATVSKIPEEHLFYLESRGIPKEQAAAMIVEGFLRDASLDTKEPV